MPNLSLASLSPALRDSLRKAFKRQLCNDPADPSHGAYITPRYEMADAAATGTPNLIAAFLQLTAVQRKADFGLVDFLNRSLPRIEAAADYLLRAQRPGGRIDLLECNYDSAPDTAFVVRLLAVTYEQTFAGGHGPAAELESLRRKLELFLRRAAEGMMTGGVHTPNHRWVVTSALCLVGKLFPDVKVRPVVDAWLAETIDINAEGFYFERSAAIYDAVCDRAMFEIDRCISHVPAREAALRNLALNLNFLNEDGTIETALSHRQDFGMRTVPRDLGGCYLRAHWLTGDPRFLAAGVRIAESPEPSNIDPFHFTAAGETMTAQQQMVHLIFNLNELLLQGREEIALPPELVNAGLPPGTVHLADAGFWRTRQGGFTASAFRSTAHLLAFRAGDAELCSLQIAQAYIGQGQFVADTLEPVEGGVTLRYQGRRAGWPPVGYFHPIGHAVARDDYYTTQRQREMINLSPPGGSVDVAVEQNGLRIEFRPDAILEGVGGQIALDFIPGGIWECDSARIIPRPGQVIFLKAGAGRMIYGEDIIEVGPGHYGHGMTAMRDAKGQGSCVRVLITFLSPYSPVIFLRAKSLA
jgi:hypothetical protein